VENQRKRCTICGREFFPNRICVGHDLGGAGGGVTEEKLNNDGNAPATFVDKLVALAGQFGSAIMQVIEGSSSEHQSHQLLFNTEIISDLLSKKILLIDNNKDSGILTIKFLCAASILSIEQRKELNKFFEAILKQLDDYKKGKGIVTDCIKREDNGNLYIALSNPKMYDEFIKILARKKLLPTQVIEQKENKQQIFQEGIDHFNQTPFLTKLVFGSRKNATEEELQKLEKQNSSSIRPRSPLDGPKPK
jgi:RNA binding exosome subunit